MLCLVWVWLCHLCLPVRLFVLLFIGFWVGSLLLSFVFVVYCLDDFLVFEVCCFVTLDLAFSVLLVGCLRVGFWWLVDVFVLYE